MLRPQTSPSLSTTMANVQAVLSALEGFSRAPEKAALEQATTWLQDFQPSVNTRFAFGRPRHLTIRFQPLPV